MWNPPTEKQLSHIPALYSTEGQPAEEKIVWMHFFLGRCDWWVVEYDPVKRIFFGYANLNDDLNAEWGYVSLDELLELSILNGIEVDRDLGWSPRPAGEVEAIFPLECAVDAHGVKHLGRPAG